MAATIQIGFFTAASTAANAETGIKFNRDATQTGTAAPIPRPTATGTNYSWTKPLALNVTVADTNITVSNRRINAAAAPSTGLTLFYRTDATYQAAALAGADNTSTNNATPSGFLALPTSAQQFDAAGVTAAAGRNGNYVSVALGVSFLYPETGAGTNIATPNLVFTWDEA